MLLILFERSVKTVLFVEVCEVAAGEDDLIALLLLCFSTIRPILLYKTITDEERNKKVSK